MVKKVLYGIISIAVALVISSSACAAGIKQRIESQQLRINRGIASGELTRHDAGDLQQYLDRIKRRHSRMAADGIVTPREQKILDKMLNKSSRMIYDKRLNRHKKSR